MEASRTSPPTKDHKGTFRILRPLVWWLLLVLVLYAIRTHQRLIEQTRLTFAAKLQGTRFHYDLKTELDGVQVSSGDRVSLGRHKFTISHPKSELFSTNLFIWYGNKNLGEIELTRSKGTLAIQSTSRATVLQIRGPDFSLTLTNTLGMTSSVPTDEYVVLARYRHGQESKTITVSPSYTPDCSFDPAIGVLELSCNQKETTFQLLKLNGEALATGKCPAIVEDLPTGNYDLITSHRGNRQQKRVIIKKGVATSFEAQFQYGLAVFETDPVGASVETRAGRSLGTTPTTIELLAGDHDLIIRRDGYERVPVLLQVVAHQTNSFRTNLVNSDYVRSMQVARQYIATADYERAWQAAKESLDIKPSDPDAIALQKSALVQHRIQNAQTLGKKKNYTEAIKALESALESEPQNQQAQVLIASFRTGQAELAAEQEKKKEQEIAEQQKAKRQRLPKEVLDAKSRQHVDSDLFEFQSFSSTRSSRELGEAICNAFTNGTPALELTSYTWPYPDVFQIEAKQRLLMGMGSRVYLVTGGQIGDNHTLVHSKVLEYENHVNVNLGFIKVSDGSPPITALHPSRKSRDSPDQIAARVREGIKIVTGKIQSALK